MTLTRRHFAVKWAMCVAGDRKRYSLAVVLIGLAVLLPVKPRQSLHTPAHEDTAV
jgi:hypothetical protein